MMKNMKQLFLSKFPKELGDRILLLANKKQLKKATCIEDLVEITLKISNRWQKLYNMINEDLKVLMGVSAYDKRFGDLQDLMTKAVTYKDEKQGLRASEHEALKSRLRSLLQIESEARQDDESDSNSDNDDDDSEASEGQNEEYEMLKAFNMAVKKKDDVKPLFDKSKKKQDLTKQKYDKDKMKDKKVDTSNVPNVCFSKFWNKTCTRKNCEYHGVEERANAEKYWTQAVQQLINHEHKPKDSVLVLHKKSDRPTDPVKKLQHITIADRKMEFSPMRNDQESDNTETSEGETY